MDDLAAFNHTYDARASVPDFDALMRHFVTASQALRDRIPGPRNVAYGPHRDEVLDIFPGGDGKSPIHLFIHGGYWRMLTKDECSLYAGAMAPAGATVLVNTYSLAPSVTLDVIVRQCQAAVAWAYKNADAIGGDRDRIFVSGHSAGGHLAGMMLTTDWAGDYGLPADVLKGVTCVSGLFDLRPVRRAFMNDWLQLDQAEAERNSPILRKVHHPCPVVLSWGEHDPLAFRTDGAQFHKHLEALGVPVQTVPMPGHHHFSVADAMADPATPLARALLHQMGLK
jgi:arylformamidase